MYKIAIFDMDGTILDTLTDVTDALNWALEKNDLPRRTKDEVRLMVGNGVKHLVECAVPADTPPSVFEKVLADNKTRYAAHCNENTRPYPGIMELLCNLKTAGVKLGVVSNKPDGAVQDLVHGVFDGLFDIAYGQKDEIPRKPNPAMVHLALDALGDSNGESAIYIGDSETDIKTAQNAGLPYLLALWGFRTKEELFAAGGKVFITSAQELQKRILKD